MVLSIFWHLVCCSRWWQRQLRHSEQFSGLDTWPTKLQSAKCFITPKLGDELPGGSYIPAGTETLGSRCIITFLFPVAHCSSWWDISAQSAWLINVSIFRKERTTISFSPTLETPRRWRRTCLPTITCSTWWSCWPACCWWCCPCVKPLLCLRCVWMSTWVNISTETHSSFWKLLNMWYLCRSMLLWSCWLWLLWPLSCAWNSAG